MIIIRDNIEGKICRGPCQSWKPLTEFFIRRLMADGHKGECKACTNQASRDYYAANRERLQTKAREKYRANPENGRAIARNYRERNLEKARMMVRRHHSKRREKLRFENRVRYQKNIEKNRAYGRSHYYEDVEKNRERSREYARLHKEERREQRKLWERRNPARVRARWHSRRLKKLTNGGSFTHEEWLDLKAHYGKRCVCCGKTETVILAEQGVSLTSDHIIPVSQGGSGQISNIQPLCRSCNSAKGTRSTDYRSNLSD